MSENQEQYIASTKPQTEAEIWAEAQCRVAVAIHDAESKTGFLAEGISIRRKCTYDAYGRVAWQTIQAVRIVTSVKETVTP